MKSIKYDNFVYMTICEISFDLFKKSKCMTYQNYCNLLKLSILDGKLSGGETSDIFEIMKVLDKLFSMNDKDTGMYIRNFFTEQKYLKFEYPVRCMLEYYPINIMV